MITSNNFFEQTFFLPHPLDKQLPPDAVAPWGDSLLSTPLISKKRELKSEFHHPYPEQKNCEHFGRANLLKKNKDELRCHRYLSLHQRNVNDELYFLPVICHNKKKTIDCPPLNFIRHRASRKEKVDPFKNNIKSPSLEIYRRCLIAARKCVAIDKKLLYSIS